MSFSSQIFRSPEYTSFRCNVPLKQIILDDTGANKVFTFYYYYFFSILSLLPYIMAPFIPLERLIALALFIICTRVCTFDLIITSDETSPHLQILDISWEQTHFSKHWTPPNSRQNFSD